MCASTYEHIINAVLHCSATSAVALTHIVTLLYHISKQVIATLVGGGVVRSMAEDAIHLLVVIRMKGTLLKTEPVAKALIGKTLYHDETTITTATATATATTTACCAISW
jgi:hypothetical protein